MRQLILFLSKYRNTLLLIVLIGLSFFRHSQKNPVAEHRINSVGFGTIAGVQHSLNSWKGYWALEAVNEELARENAALRASIFGNGAPAFHTNEAYDYIPAQVIEYSYNKRNNYMLLNVGTGDGIHPGMGVISAHGWIGTVVESSKNYSSIIPLLHSKGSIGARIPGKGLGELRWEGNDHRSAELFDVQREHRPMSGDTVYSYTRASVAPPVMAGVVESASQNPEDLTWVANVNLSHDFANMTWVYVCRLHQQESLDSLNLPAP